MWHANATAAPTLAPTLAATAALAALAACPTGERLRRLYCKRVPWCPMRRRGPLRVRRWGSQRGLQWFARLLARLIGVQQVLRLPIMLVTQHVVLLVG